MFIVKLGQKNSLKSIDEIVGNCDDVVGERVLQLPLRI